MSLRSVDMQVLIPKVSEVSRNQPVQNQQDQTHQQQFAATMKKETEVQRQQVQNSDRSEGGRIDQETARNKKEQEQKKKQDQKQEQEAVGEKAKDPSKGNLLDIKI